MNVNEQLENKQKLMLDHWYANLSPAINRAVGMLMVHPDKINAPVLVEELSHASFDMDRLAEIPPELHNIGE